jgi:aminopeptidase
MPSTASALAAGYTSLREAAIEARKINRVGKLSEHSSNLQKVTDKLNELVKQGYRTLHFISVKPNTEIPDGETDLRVGLTPKSIFVSVGEETPSGQTYIANVPSEESFTTPDRTKTEGKAKVTRPISMYGSIIDGIRFEFKEGKVVKASASKNEDVLLKWLEKNEGVDRLGEISVVAESPIFDLGRIFNSILIDENATCHFALGKAYSACIEGADDIANQEEKRKYLNELKVNDGTDHVDFMIGEQNVMVFAEKLDGSDKKLLVKDNKFQI